MNDEIELKQLQDTATVAVDEFRDMSGLGAGFGYNAQSLEWLDGYIEETRGLERTSEELEALERVIGAYLGECMIATYGGKWEKSEDGWGVTINDSLTVFPFRKVAKQFAYGHENSIYSMFGMIPNLSHDPAAHLGESAGTYKHIIISKTDGNPPKYEYLATLEPYEWTPDVNPAYEFSTRAEAKAELERIQPTVPDRTLVIGQLDNTTYTATN